MVDLRFVIEKNPNCFVSRFQLAKFLNDIYPYSKREVNVALIVYDSGIASRLSIMSEVDNNQMKNFEQQLYDEFGLSKEFAALGIEIWANAYNVPVKDNEKSFVPPTEKDSKTADITTDQQEVAEIKAADAPVVQQAEAEIKTADAPIVQQEVAEIKTADVPIVQQAEAEVPIDYQEMALAKEKKSSAIHTAVVQPPVISSNIPHAVANNRSIQNPTPKQSTVLKSSVTSNGKVIVLEYAFCEEGYYITKLCGNAVKELTVPSVIEGKTIIGIGKNVFRGASEIQKLTISEGIKFIEDGAFYECVNLKELVLPETLLEIGSSKKNQDIDPEKRSGAFEKCTALTEIDIPDSVLAINDSAFCACENLKKVLLSEKLKIIRDYAFYGCRKLKEVYFGKHITRIGYWAFYWCKSLKTVALNEGLQRIGEEAFGYCDSITKFLMPSSVSQIDRNIFCGSVNKKLTVYCVPDTFSHDYIRNKGYKIEDINKFKA